MMTWPVLATASLMSSISTGTCSGRSERGPLDSPWGLAIAPSSFGRFAGDLLVGNFGDGRINMFDQNTGQPMGRNGKPISIDGLWTLTPENGGSAGDPSTIYFTAGPAGETEGPFGSLSPVAHGAHSA